MFALDFLQISSQSNLSRNVEFSCKNGVMNFLVALSPIFRPTVNNTHGRIAVRYSGPQVSKDVQCDHTAVLISSENNVAMVRVCYRIVIPHSKTATEH